MTLSEIKKRVKAENSVRAYFTLNLNNSPDFDLHKGDRGDLTVMTSTEDQEFLFFQADNDSDILHVITDIEDIHVPSIGHYSWIRN